MKRLGTLIELLRNQFWVLPALAILAAIAAGIVLPSIDDRVELPAGMAFNPTPDTARAVLQLIATVAVSVAGISFSVIVVALVLTSQQLSPRVLRNFQRQPVNQLVLGFLLGTAAFSLFVLGSVEDGQEPVPELAITLAMGVAGIALALFVVFLHHMVRSLNAAAVIRRLAADGHKAVDAPYPTGAGEEADDPAVAERTAQETMARFEEELVRAERAGYVASVEAADIVRAAERAGGFVAQEVDMGRFVVSGALLARVWCPAEAREALVEQVQEAFVLNEERIVDDDVAFPVRQLSDVALRGLSPSLNDPTTAENAMDSVADTLARLGRQDQPQPLRLSEAGAPRFRALQVDFDRLVQLGFDQVRRDAAPRPSFAVRLLELLADVRSLGGETAARSREIDRQARLIATAAADAARLEEDSQMVEEAYERLHGGRRDPVPPRATAARS